MEYKAADEAFVIHEHCFSCIKVAKCTVRPRPGESCAIITCELKCGACFHGCKKGEHQHLCINEKVPCINSVNGCPVWMYRRHLGPHLEKCPASVVHCTMEWNRWPLEIKDRDFSHCPHHHKTQMPLDEALALRDQRMLNQYWCTPRKTRRSLRNPLTRKYPAVPLHPYRGTHEPESAQDSTQTSRGVSDDESDAPWEMRKAPPGLQRSVCSELYRATRETTEMLSAALNVITNHQSHQSADETWKDSNCYSSDIEVWNGSSVENKENVCRFQVHVANIPDGCLDKHSFLQEVTERDDVDADRWSEASSGSNDSIEQNGEIINMPIGESSYGTLFVNDTIEFRRDEYAWHYRNVHGDIHGGLNGWLEQRCPLAQYGCMFSCRRFYPAPKGSVVLHSDILESFGVQPPLWNDEHNITNQMDWKHTRRSPGRTEKLTFQRRTSMEVIPEAGDSSLKNGTCGGNQKGMLHITQFPFEVLQHIARFLDGFSLCNLALTSKLFRDIASSLLDEKGLVIFQWERRKCSGGRYSWCQAYKRWFFSTAFSPIYKWCFEDGSHMSNHLQQCPYFFRNIKYEPFYFPMSKEPNQETFEKLKNMIRLPEESDKDSDLLL
ncbi:F-box only protein 30-like isoform X2 [Limulus polyphemus]|uniref:F-box only protein 30-like isoform X2 n=1 Tax=Limulus polyphemus TaxID=6850 RepID=A0ABM1T8N7_LIMPO|nr:F-box only protein 30-like isoform X2 [Limulus polyphemus]